MIDEENKQELSIVLFWYDKKHYEDVFKKVGFVKFRWVDLALYGDERNADFWNDFLTDNTIMMYEAFRPSQ